MNIKELQRNWDEFGKTDPLWSILTEFGKQNNKWDLNEFFQTGHKEIEELINYTGSLGITYRRRNALDFGCGVGRLTQALGEYFDEVIGVDISPHMIDLANRHNRHGDRCKYYLNRTSALSFLDDRSIDFIYSNLVLQHMLPVYSRRYIKEFLRILSLEGVLVFQQPYREMPGRDGGLIRTMAKNVLPSVLVDLFRNKVQSGRCKGPKMEMYEVRPEQMTKFLVRRGSIVADIRRKTNEGSNWISTFYFVKKTDERNGTGRT